MSAPSNVAYGASLYPFPGWRKSARVNGVPLLIDSGNMGSQNNIQYTRYALTLPTGPRQKTLHSRGTKEQSWNISGDLMIESQDVIQFLTPSIRGILFPVEIFQGVVPDRFDAAILESFNLTGTPDGLIKYTITGKALAPATIGAPWTFSGYRYTVPSWASGAPFVKSWSLTHQIALQANWANDQNPLPVYYRPGESEFTMTINTTPGALQYDTISIGVGSFAMVTGLVTSEMLQFSGRESRTYEVQVTNVNVAMNALTSGAVATAAGSPPSDWI